MVGSARSGNTLLYHTLLSSGYFADYRGEPAVFDLIAPRFGNLGSRRNRERLLKVWLRSKMYRVSGLQQSYIRDKLLNDCRSRGDFLRILMDEVARSQGLQRWAVWGPDNLLCMTAIKQEIPDALFIHMIRDGRDVALSMHREGWIAPFPWDRRHGLLAAALHWKWKVERGIRDGSGLDGHYLEVHFEELVTTPPEILARISNFIAQDLDENQIRQRSVGTIAVPNSTFLEEIRSSNFRPVARWRRMLAPKELETVEAAVGPLLRDLGYALETTEIPEPSFQERLGQILYPRYFDTKSWLKFHTFLGRMTAMQRLHVSP